MFIGAEIAQRVRYALRYEHPYWLLYGFREITPDVRAGVERYYRVREDGEQRPAQSPREFYYFTKPYEGYFKLQPGRFRLRAKEGVYYSINSHGFRSKEFTVPKPEGVVRIVCFGGLSTFGALNDDNHTYPALLGQRLAYEPGGRYEVINAGFASMTLENIDGLFSHERTLLDPDIIIVYSLFNNLINSTRPLDSQPEYWAWRFRAWFINHSLLFTTALEKYAAWRYGLGFIGAVHGNFQDFARNRITEEATWQPFRNHLNHILSEAKNNGVRVLLIKQALRLFEGPNARLFQPRDLWEAHIARAHRITEELGCGTGPAFSMLRLSYHPKRPILSSKTTCIFRTRGTSCWPRRSTTN